jgi:hypothetical protein
MIYYYTMILYLATAAPIAIDSSVTVLTVALTTTRLITAIVVAFVSSLLS